MRSGTCAGADAWRANSRDVLLLLVSSHGMLSHPEVPSHT
jgi:hypothetical protein